MKPSLRAIVWNDWPALACFFAIPIMWVIYCIFPVLNPSAIIDVYTLLLPASASILCGGLLAWRIRRIERLFAHGNEVPGEIVALSILGDLGRLEYAYQWGENVRLSWIPVHKTRRVLEFSHRQAIRVLVDPAKPNKSIIRELFE